MAGKKGKATRIKMVESQVKKDKILTI
jgi:hypothetical protein